MNLRKVKLVMFVKFVTVKVRKLKEQYKTEPQMRTECLQNCLMCGKTKNLRSFRSDDGKESLLTYCLSCSARREIRE